jgi:hypothetical protein
LDNLMLLFLTLCVSFCDQFFLLFTPLSNHLRFNVGDSACVDKSLKERKSWKVNVLVLCDTERISETRYL